MTFRNEVLEGIAAYKALAPSSQDRYYDYLLQKSRQKGAEEDELEKIGKAAYEEAKKRGGVPGVPTTVVPQVAAPAMPGATTPQMAFNPSPPTDPNLVGTGGLYRRGGKVKRFASGGSVDPTNPGMSEDEANLSEADLIVRQLLGERGTAAQQINRQVGAPPDIDHIPTTDEYAVRGEMLRQDEAAKTAGAQSMDAARFQEGTPMKPPRSRLQRVLGAIDEFVSPTGTEGQYRHEQKQREAIRQTTPGITEQLGDVDLAERERQLAELYQGRAGVPQRMEGPQPGAVEGPPPAPGQPPRAVVPEPPPKPGVAEVAAANGVSAPPSPSRPAGAGDPSVYGRVPGPRMATGEVDVNQVPRPTPYPARASNGPKGGGAGTNGPAGGNTGPGSGAGATPAPPASAARIEDPRTRTAAFDPGRERINPDRTTAARQMDPQGNVVFPTPQEMQQMVATAAQARVGANGSNGAPAIGDGAVSRPTVQALIAENNPGGRLTEGQALMAGMHAKFRHLLYKGRAKEAATMAWGLIQAANLEAASLGLVARDQARAGDLNASRQTIAKALNWAPDGMSHVATPNGIATYDANGRMTANTPLNAQQVLAVALGLSDGSAIWQMLQSAAAVLTPPDKNAEGRGLRNELTRLQIEKARRGLSGAGKGGGGGATSDTRLLQHILAGGTGLPPASGGGGGGTLSDDTNFIEAANASDLRE